MTRPARKRRLILGMSGASGAIIGVRALQALRATPGIETHLIPSSAARPALVEETDRTAGELEVMADASPDHLALEVAEAHRKHGLHPLQRLDLTLLIRARHQRLSAAKRRTFQGVCVAGRV